ncbi:50S ribosomal protein L7/L12 [Clostridium botulinum]|uniref:ribosomal protein L7/L12 n=1 Tax=Clostridium botulinum TaxID=1491 RepID=UPI000772E7CE|nr:ribosomal protein L7/L12 [Clostridium botulinum]MBN1042250.1 50S ribosomal protein L7/L12 [Clostridium botulinum]MBN1048938.1 50S ribosomal protein L7/L12 [Clostridium botulinum]MBN1074508.1 50S ribosomal protein L7/L12 [Clostridium botulinum]MBY6916290.1 ribosomal protein L7/L12 [Clostridium botulinum]NFG37486.1 50S ribosomal protein L7/L12 [Clostridium botulinum]
MNYTIIALLGGLGLLMWIVSNISQMKNDISRININLNKIDNQVGVPNTINDEIKNLILEGKKVEAIKKYRIITGIGLKEAKEYIDSLNK